MALGVSIEEAPDHSLILGVVLPCLALEEFDAAPAQSKGHFDPVVPKDQVLWLGKKIGNDLKFSEGFVCVFDFRAHRFAFLFANNRLRKCE